MQSITTLHKIIGKIICLLLLFVTSKMQAQFNTPALNGSIAAGEYGTHTNGQNQELSGATTWYMTWDATYLYIATSGTNINEACVVYLDTNPVSPVNGPNTADGSVQGYSAYDGLFANLPFRADRVLYFKSGYGEYRTADGSGYWSGSTALSGSDVSASGSVLEMRISWASLGGMPAKFNWFGTKVYSTGSYAQMPTENPTGTGEVKYTTYYNILSTASGAATKPFATKSLTWYTTRSGIGYVTGGGYAAYSGAQPAKLHDLTINTNDNSNAIVIPSASGGGQNGNRIYWTNNLEITHDIYIGQNSSLFTAINSTPTVTMTGTGGRITVNGRIDTNQDFGSAAASNATDMRFVFDGTTYLTFNTDKQFTRLSDITINAGKSVLADAASGDCEFEVQQGVMDIRGTLDLYYNLTNRINLWTRGNWDAFANTYTIIHSVAPTTEPELDGLYVGRRTVSLNASAAETDPGRLLAGGTLPVRFHLKGNFANYSEFVPKAATGGTIDLIFDGAVTQYIRGNYQETRLQNSTADAIAGITSAAFPTGKIPRTNLHNIEVNNAANVQFETYQTFGIAPVSNTVFSNIRYMISGELKLTNGHLKTRNSAACPEDVNFHIVTLMNNATLAGGSSASYVHGPIRWEIKNAALPVMRTFPIGKGTATYRPMQPNITAQNAATLVYNGELMACTTGYTINNAASANGRATLPGTAGESIVAIASPRYWTLRNDPDNAVSGETFTMTNKLNYGADDVAGISQAPKVRLVKNNNGDAQYYNIGATGAVVAAAGSATSDAITSLSDFSIGSIGAVLPVKMLSFTGHRLAKANKLQWATATELNNDRFEIERSTDGKNWQTIGTVRGSGTTNTLQNYTFLDNDAKANTNYYRLRQIDFDGATDVSAVVTIFGQTQNGFVIAPNPIQNETTILLAEPTQNATVQVIDITGRVLSQINYADNQTALPLDIHDLPNGIYFVRLSNDGKVMTERVVKH
jgi:Secretion system C-terminal sorting domain